MKQYPGSLLILFTLTFTVGCAPGYNSVVFVTRSNAGIDLDATPVTTEATIAREEYLIAPAYENGQTLPVLASFSSDHNFASKFLFGVGSTFSTGEAAYNMAYLYNSQSEMVPLQAGCNRESKVQLSSKPDLPGLLDFLEAGETKPVVFTTNTMLGLKVGWANGTAPVPTTLKIGFNRKEIAWAPVGIEDCSLDATGSRYAANIPSLLATLDASSEAGQAGNTNLTFLQYFASGAAAIELSKKYGVRRSMLTRLDPANEARFEARQIEIDGFNSRIETAQALAIAAIGRIPDPDTTDLINGAKTILDKLGHDPADCPQLTGNRAIMIGILRACAEPPSNDNELAVKSYEDVVEELRAAIP